MAKANTQQYMTVEEYLEFEERSQTQHEFIDGQVWAMTGGSARHARIISNIHIILGTQLKGRPCNVFINNFKVRVESTNSFYYPDVLVFCEKAKAADDEFTSTPLLVVEVLSRSTAAIDKREKLFAYRQIPSLKEYAIVHQKRNCIELHRREENGTWQTYQYEGTASVELKSLPVSVKLPLADVYEGTDTLSARDFTVSETTESEYFAGADDECPDYMLDW